MRCEPLLELYTSHRINLEMFGEIQDDIGLEGDAPRSEALVNGLGCEADLAEDTELVSAEGELGVLQVSHLEADVLHEVVVNQGGGGCRQVWRHQTAKRSSFDTEDKFCFVVCVPVTHCGIELRTIHHLLCTLVQFYLSLDLSEVEGALMSLSVNNQWLRKSLSATETCLILVNSGYSQFHKNTARIRFRTICTTKRLI